MGYSGPAASWIGPNNNLDQTAISWVPTWLCAETLRFGEEPDRYLYFGHLSVCTEKVCTEKVCTETMRRSQPTALMGELNTAELQEWK